MNSFNSNNTTNRAANYQSSQSLPKRYQSPSQGPSHYFLSSAKTTGSHPKTASQSVQQLQQSLQPTNLSLSSSTQQQQPYQTGISSSSQQVQQTGQSSSQQQQQQYPLSYESNFISPPSSANQSGKPLFLKNTHSTNSLSMINPLQQQQQLLLQQQQSRLKMTKHKSSQGNPTISNNNNMSGSSSSGPSQSSAATLKQSIKATLMQSQSSQRMGMHQGDYQTKAITTANSAILPYPPSSARVKTDYSQEKKPSNYLNSQDPLLSPGAYSSFSSYKSQSLVGQSSQQQHGHSSHLFTSPLSDKLQQQQLQQKNTGNSSSSSNSTHNNPFNNRQDISTAASSSTGYRQSLQPQQQQQSQQRTAKKQKSQQISQLLKTEPNACDFSPTNLTVFIHCKGHRIGPISLGVVGKNVEWLTKQLINEIIMYEQFQMPENDGQTGLETENILHFQSYQHKNISLSYYLTLKDRPLDPLFHKSLILEPFYSEPTETLDGSAEKQVSLMHFHFIKCVGMGGFSRVYLVQKKDTGKMYALKLIEKKFIQTNKKEVIVQNERNIMTIMQGHPFLLQLDYAFESKNYIAFAMEYCAGGEMFYHLRKIKKMTEEQARFYFIEICLGIDFLHERHIIYRDIKPENILLDIDGHIRIGDFGLSKPDMDENEFAYSFCGSPEYMAPEMLLKVGHAYPVDHYTLGALLYELVTGLPPFYSQITEEIYKSILSEELTFPDHADISNELKHLLRGLLTKHPLQRLGQTSGTKEILSHPWCRKININDIVFKKIEPPMKIDVIGFNFDEEEFAKGESEFKAKLMTSYYVQQNEFMPMFPDFYYESPSVRAATAQLNKQLAEEQRQSKQKELQQQQSFRKQQQQQQPQSLSPNKGQNILMNANNASNGNALIAGSNDQTSQYSQKGSYSGSVRVSQSNIANPEVQLPEKQSAKSQCLPQPLQILNSTPAQQQQQQQQQQQPMNPSQSSIPIRTQPLWQSQTNTPYSSFLSPQTKSASGPRISTNTGTSHKQSQMILQEKLPQDQKENKATLLLETFNQVANTDRNSNSNGNKQQQFNSQDNHVYPNNGHNYNNSASVIGNTYGLTSNNNNSSGSQVAGNNASSSNSKNVNAQQSQQLSTQQVVLGTQGMSSNNSNNSNMHGKNSKSVQMKQTQPILSGYTSQQQLHVKNSNSLSSATKQQQQQQQQQQTAVKVQNNNYFLSNGAATGQSHNNNNNPSNAISITTANPLSTSSSQPNINNPLYNTNSSHSNSNAAKMLLQQQQQQQKKQQNIMSLSTSHAQQQQQQQFLQQSSAGLRMRTEERERTYEDYESMFAFQPQVLAQQQQQQQAQNSQQLQQSQQSSNLLASSHQLKKLAAARSHFNFSTNGNSSQQQYQYANSSNSMIKGAQDLKRTSANATNSASTKSLQQIQKGSVQINSNTSNSNITNPSSSLNGFNYTNNGNSNSSNTNNSQDYSQSLTHNINGNNNNYFASSLYASSGSQQQPSQAGVAFNPSSSEQQQQQQYQPNQLLGSYGGFISNRSSWNPSTASTAKNAQMIPTSKINNLNGSTTNSNNANVTANNQQLSSRNMTSPRTGSVGLTSMSKNSGGVPTAIGQIASSKVYNPLGYI